MPSAGQTSAKWVSTPDDRVRDSHKLDLTRRLIEWHVVDQYIFYPVVQNFSLAEVGKQHVCVIRRGSFGPEIVLVYYPRGGRMRIAGGLSSLSLASSIRESFARLIPHVTYFIGPN